MHRICSPAAKSELQASLDSDKLLREAAAKMDKDLAQQHATPAAKNALVVKPHVKEFDDILGMK